LKNEEKKRDKSLPGTSEKQKKKGKEKKSLSRAYRKTTMPNAKQRYQRNNASGKGPFEDPIRFTVGIEIRNHD